VGSPLEIIDVSDNRPWEILSPKGQQCTKKGWEADPLLCPKCGGEMKNINFITETEVVCRILTHLELWEEKAPVECPSPVSNSERYYQPVEDS
jgi:hypothetical protein